jgi:hypothetical protein
MNRIFLSESEDLLGGGFLAAAVVGSAVKAGCENSHDKESLEALLGSKCREKVDDLQAVGFLQRRPKGKAFIVPFIFRAGMGKGQGKAG